MNILFTICGEPAQRIKNKNIKEFMFSAAFLYCLGYRIVYKLNPNIHCDVVLIR